MNQKAKEELNNQRNYGNFMLSLEKDEINNFFKKLDESDNYNPEKIKKKKQLNNIVSEVLKLNNINYEYTDNCTLFNLISVCNENNINYNAFFNSIFNLLNQDKELNFTKNITIKNKIYTFKATIYNNNKIYISKADHQVLTSEYGFNVCLVLDKKQENVMLNNKDTKKMLTKFKIIDSNTNYVERVEKC